MIGQVIYILSTIILLILATLYKKSDKKINFLEFAAILVVSFLCYNSLLCFILNLTRISITLISLGIINLLVSLIFLINIFKNKQIQKFSVNKKDIFSVIIILIITLVMAYLNFGLDLHIKYITTDASVHFKAAREFYENDKLLNRTEGTTTPKEFMLGAYTNTGILFKIAEPIIGEINLYKIFICFDIFVYFLIGLMMYVSAEQLIKTKFSYFLSLICVIIFMLGYPLNSFIYGYVYLQLGVLIINTIIVLYQFIDKMNKYFIYAILAILNFGLFFTYCIFVPVVYFAQGLYFLIKEYDKNKKIFTVNSITKIFTILVIPFILGIGYFALPHILNEQGQFFLTIEGYIYRNCWSNFILLFSLALMYFEAKNNKKSVDRILFITLLIYMAILFFVIHVFKLSTYYYYKNNFVLWFAIWYGVIQSVNILVKDKKGKRNIIIYFIIYIILMCVAIAFKKVPITKERIDIDENISNAFDIFCINKTIIKDVEIDYTSDEMEILKYVQDNIDVKKNKILILGNTRQECWFDGIFEYRNREDLQTYIPEEDVQAWNNNQKFKYLIVFYRSYPYNFYKDTLIYKDKIFENETGAIYIDDNI